MIHVLLFTLTFFLIVNRYWIISFWEGLTVGRPNSKDIEDPKILSFIRNKTGLNLSKIKLFDTDKTWAMMAGIPTMPYMVISKDAYENFTKDEMQWLLLHEAGHYVLWHNVKMLFLQFLFILIGAIMIVKFNTHIPAVIFSLTLGILLAIIYTQLARRFEYEANYYALSKMDNPKGLVNIFDKARKRWWDKKGLKEDTFWQRLFNVWLLEIYVVLAKKAKT